MLKKILCSVISFILCAVVAFVACYFAIPDFNIWVKGVIGADKNTSGDKGGNSNYEDNCDLNFADGENNGIALLSAKLPFSAYSANGIDSSNVVYMLTATITPITAENKAVEWALAWADSSIAESVTDYLKLTPTSSGALTATIECLAPFKDKQAVVTVTTVDGGFTASCYVSFFGKPTSILINNGSAGSCNIGSSASFNISLSNIYNEVGNEFYDNLIIAGVSFGGTCTTRTKWVTVSGRNAGTVSYSADSEKNNVSITDLKLEGSSYLTDNFNFSVSNGKLNVSAPSLAKVYSHYSPASGTPQESYLDHYYSNWNGYANITVSCGTLSATFTVNFILGVEGVSITPNIEF